MPLSYPLNQAPKFKDFEDAVLHEAAKQVKVQGIVTRNAKDFKKATLSIYSPEELDKMLISITGNAN
jgi:hypothetical protein